MTLNNGVFFILRFIFWRDHSMTTANLNKSKDLVIDTTTASKYIPRKSRICINRNPPFKTQIYFVKAHLSVNIVKQDLHTYFIITVFENFMKWSLKGCQLMLILGLLSVYFDAAVVFVTKSSLLYRLTLAILCDITSQNSLKYPLPSQIFLIFIPLGFQTTVYSKHLCRIFFVKYST